LINSAIRAIPDNGAGDRPDCRDRCSCSDRYAPNDSACREETPPGGASCRESTEPSQQDGQPAREPGLVKGIGYLLGQPPRDANAVFEADRVDEAADETRQPYD
jgi:hypothetical protein